MLRTEDELAHFLATASEIAEALRPSEADTAIADVIAWATRRHERIASRNASGNTSGVLPRRLVRLLLLLPHSDAATLAAEVDPVLAKIRSLRVQWSEGVGTEAERAVRDWGASLVAASEQGRSAAATLALAPLIDHRSRLERELKKAAMHLVAAGAEVAGLSDDAVPLVAYALLAGILPAGPRAENEELEDKLIDAMLGVADTSATLPADQRLVFVSYHRLAFLLGLAEGYAERLSLSKLSVS